MSESGSGADFDPEKDTAPDPEPTTPSDTDSSEPETPDAEEPAADEPAAEEPTPDESAPDEPVAEEPTPDEPVAEEPTPDEPVAEEPTPEEPAADTVARATPVSTAPDPLSPAAGKASFFRSYAGRIWLTALVLVPLLLGLIGYAMFQRARLENGGEPAPQGPLPTLTEPADAPAAPTGPSTAEAPPQPAFAPLSIIRRGNEVTLTGDLPDPAARRRLLDAVVTSIDDVNIVDNLNVVPGTRALDFASAAPLFDAATLIRNFTLTVDGDTVTLGGTAVKAADADAVGEAAQQAWPQTNIVNTLEISSLIVPPTPSR